MTRSTRTPISTEAQTRTTPIDGEPPSSDAGLVPGLTVIYHPEIRRIGDRVLLPELGESTYVPLSRLSPTFAAPGREARRPLADCCLSRRPMLLRGSRDGEISIERDGSPTPLRVAGRASESALCSPEQLLRSGLVFTLGGGIVLLLHRIDPCVHDALPRHGLVGESAGILQIQRAIRHVAPLDVPVLLRGESGTGKELVAEAIHRASGKRGPFVPVNMAALPATLAPAELFGAERGAYTGAESARQGLFARAGGGTLFLDEIGEAPKDVQAQLLRALESGEIQPLGGVRPRKTDARIVAATDADLESSAVFRAPLLHRLAGFPIHLPPLRHRRDDIGRLLRHFLHQELRSVGALDALDRPRRPWLPASLAARLCEHDWPGNVRELRNVVRQLVILHHDRDTVPADCRVGASPRPRPPRARKRRRPGDISETELLDALRRERFRLQATADRLSIPRSSLYRLIERSGSIRTAADLDAREIRSALKTHPSLESAAETLEVSAVGLRRRVRTIPTLDQPS